jgi:outer membrane autotransporter protein
MGIYSLIELIRPYSWQRKYRSGKQPMVGQLGLVSFLALLLPFTSAMSQTPEEAALSLLFGDIIDPNTGQRTDGACDGENTQEFDQFCSSLEEASFRTTDLSEDEEKRDQLRQIAWEENAAMSTLSVETSSGQLGNLGARLGALRQGAALGFDFRGLALNIDGQTIRGPFLASLEEGTTSTYQIGNPNSRLGVFVNGTVSFGDRDRTTQEDGFDFDTVGITGGVDYRFTDNFIIGVAIGYASMDADFDELEDEVEVDGYSASLYSTYYIKDFYIDFIASAGLNDYETTRNTKLEATGVFKTANGDTDGTQYTVGLGAGYEFKVAGAILAPYVQVNYLNADIDGFRETGGDVINLEIGDQDIESLISVVGGQASYTIRTGFVDLVPQVRAEWWHEFENDSRSLEASFVNDLDSVTRVIPTDDPDRNYFNLGLTLLGVFSEDASGFVECQTVLGIEDITNHIVRGGIRLNF